VFLELLTREVFLNTGLTVFSFCFGRTLFLGIEWYREQERMKAKEQWRMESEVDLSYDQGHVYVTS
jgi:hypothetical protein